jgi:hypothetical protein
MNLRKLKKEFSGSGIEVSRDRKQKVAIVNGAGLIYCASEKEFRDEADLAAYMKSKIPVISVKPMSL